MDNVRRASIVMPAMKRVPSSGLQRMKHMFPGFSQDPQAKPGDDNLVKTELESTQGVQEPHSPAFYGHLLDKEEAESPWPTAPPVYLDKTEAASNSKQPIGFSPFYTAASIMSSNKDIIRQVNFIRDGLKKISEERGDPKIYQCFQFLLDPLFPNNYSQNLEVFCLGSADGSLGRVVLFAIQSGKMILNENGLNDLLEILKHEAIALSNCEEMYEIEKTNTNIFKNYQANDGLSKKMMSIVSNAIFKSSKYKLIYLGNLLHGLFSCNKLAMRELIERLIKVDAQFVTGRHDTSHCVEKESDKYGSFAAVRGETNNPKEEWGSFVRHYFVNSCHYKNLLFVHNGLRYSGPKKLNSTFGPILVDEELPPEEYAHALSVELNAFNLTYRDAKDFMPNEMSLALSKIPFTLVHACVGFAGFYNPVVFNLNSRMKLRGANDETLHVPMGLVFGERTDNS